MTAQELARRILRVVIDAAEADETVTLGAVDDAFTRVRNVLERAAAHEALSLVFGITGEGVM